MTIRVRIKNADEKRNVVVTEDQYNKALGKWERRDRLVLHDGESREFYVHLMKRLVIEEEEP